MALPKLEVPSYELELPISKKKIKFRPFLVKEQKMLLMAMESNDSKTIQNAVFDLLNVCTLTDNFNIAAVPIIDIEYYFLNLRAKSVGEIAESKYRCNNEVETEEGDKKECGNVMESKINLLDIQPSTDVVVDPEIKLTDNVSVKMKYPEFGVMQETMDNKNIADLSIVLIANCIEYIYDGEQFYYANETSPEELIEFIEMLNQEQFEKLENYFNNMPKLRKKVEMTCKKCGFNHSFDVEGLESFFG